jgi:hypothetical protein
MCPTTHPRCWEIPRLPADQLSSNFPPVRSFDALLQVSESKSPDQCGISNIDRSASRAEPLERDMASRPRTEDTPKTEGSRQRPLRNHPPAGA